MRDRRSINLSRLDGERAQHTVHRLEAFSDIVMGFCLAQIGLSLVLPKSSADVVTVWESSTFFIGAFVFIALLWWLHHRTFSTFFVLDTSMILMNFGMLCGLILTLYFLESVVHVAASGQHPVFFFNLCFLTFAAVYALLGGMLLVGLCARYSELAPADIRWAIGQLANIAMAVVFFVYAGTYSVVNAHRITIGYAGVAILVAIVVVVSVLSRRTMRGESGPPLVPTNSGPSAFRT